MVHCHRWWLPDKADNPDVRRLGSRARHLEASHPGNQIMCKLKEKTI